MEIHKDFGSFMKSVSGHKSLHPGTIRLDGKQTGGSLKTFGLFRHLDRVWQVREDTHYRPLEIALEAYNTRRDHFIESDTKNGKGECLSLVGELRAIQIEELRRIQKPPFKYMYIYPTHRPKL